MNKFKLFFLLVILLCIPLDTYTQYIDNLKLWKENNQFTEIHYQDFSKAFYYPECSYIGVLGNKFQKINVRFDSVINKKENNYLVYGKIQEVDRIYNFRGTLTIDGLQLVYFVRDYNQLCLLSTGNFELSSINYNSIQIKGVFRKFIIYSIKQDLVETADSYMELSTNEGFAGVWIDKVKKDSLPCFFGFHRYPESLTKDFDTRGGVPIINPKYQKYGWDAYFKDDLIGEYYNTECYDNWWVDSLNAKYK